MRWILMAGRANLRLLESILNHKGRLYTLMVPAQEMVGMMRKQDMEYFGVIITRRVILANNVGAPLKGPATNNRAEYTAVIVALKQAIEDGHSHIIIRTDSNLLIMSMTQWLHWWKKNKYKKIDGTPVLNVDLIKELDNLMQNMFVKFEHVKAHAGIYGNEMADKLARQGAKKYIRG